jgi:hypothetical protein
MTTPLLLEDMPRFTAWGAIVQTAQFSGVPIPIIDQTTLNKEYNIYPNEQGNHSTPPPPNYFAVGYGSTYTRPNSQLVEESVNYVHDPLDANLFHLCPLVLREQGKDDLTAERRAKYAGRAIINHEGKTYVGYLLKNIDRSASVITADIVIPPESNDPDGVATRTPIVGDPRYLSPTPTKLTDATVRKDGAYVEVSCALGMVFDVWELNELIKAKQILTGSSLEITEVALFSGYKVQKTVADGAASITYNEAIEAQMAVVMPTRIVASHYLDEGITLLHDVGVNNPTNFARPF